MKRLATGIVVGILLVLAAQQAYGYFFADRSTSPSTSTSLPASSGTAAVAALTNHPGAALASKLGAAACDGLAKGDRAQMREVLGSDTDERILDLWTSEWAKPAEPCFYTTALTGNELTIVIASGKHRQEFDMKWDPAQKRWDLVVNK